MNSIQIRSLHTIAHHQYSLSMTALEAIRWQRGPPASLKLLDQRLLPLKTVYTDVADPKAAWQAIKVSQSQALKLWLVSCRTSSLCLVNTHTLAVSDGWQPQGVSVYLWHRIWRYEARLQ